MTEPSNIRKLLTDPKLGLIPQLEQCLNDIEVSFGDKLENLHLEPYDFQFGSCNTSATTNGPRPLITQSISMRFPITGSAEDQFELLLLASEVQNTLDAAIFDWSNLEWYQFEKPLKRPVTQITGYLDYKLLEQPANSCRITVYREFDFTYAVTF